MRCILAGVILALAASSPAIAQECTNAEKARLQELDKAWGDATTSGDRAQLQTIYAADYHGTTLNGTDDRTSVVDAAVSSAERTKATGKSGPLTTYDNYIITCTPATAVITHRNSTTTTMNGHDETSYSRSVHFMEKRAGRWQVVGNAGHPLTESNVLLYMENDWNEASIRKNVAWFERNYASDASDVLSRNGALQTKSEAIASMRTDKTVLESLDLSEMSPRVDGNAAIVTGVIRVRGRDEQNKAFDRRVRFTDTFIKRDGRWQVWASQGTLIP
ncbi:MAG TPA: nuclear transport factor 2 family protein [Gemmatimonadaceae bacterium]|nr:nuclear transport factor 2 family protein [Gemmatimonadaceae bacterium]